MTLDIREDFAGPGGWSQALHALGHGHRALGYEYDEHACLTAEAAGHLREQNDVRGVDAASFPGMAGYIASPPCQSFSAAGKGAGRKHLAALIAAAYKVAFGATPEDAIAAVHDDALDERSLLVLHPLTVIRDGRPEWVALEQVPAVGPMWNTYSGILTQWGYHVATGLLSAEQYGVPQTRKRAVLIAHHTRPVHLPPPTHSRYYSRDKARLDLGVLPWVSMATALGWGLAASPSPTITGGGTETGGAEPIAHLSRYPGRADWRPRFAGAGQTSERTAGQIPRDPDEPAHTLTGKGAAAWVQRSNYKSGDNPDARGIRELTDPSATITSRPPQWSGEDDLGDRATSHGTIRRATEPAPTLAGSLDNGNTRWTSGVRVTVQEAGILQSFPADYPWQGTKSQQYQQVGNAIPPLLAQAILQELI